MTVQTEKRTVPTAHNALRETHDRLWDRSVETCAMVACIDLYEEMVHTIRVLKERHMLFHIHEKIQRADSLGVLR